MSFVLEVSGLIWLISFSARERGITFRFPEDLGGRCGSEQRTSCSQCWVVTVLWSLHFLSPFCEVRLKECNEDEKRELTALVLVCCFVGHFAGKTV